jgi:peptidoglycan/xylan/chitin deacetylase (PgdA/CDA1 family)
LIQRPGWLPSFHHSRRGLAVVLALVAGIGLVTIAGAPTRAPGFARAGPARMGPAAPAGDLDGEGIPALPLILSAAPGPTVTIPILVYHFIRVNPLANDRTGHMLSVTPSAFAAQLAYLKSQGVRCLSPGEVFESLRTGRQPQGRVAMLTFDDGFEDFATVAAPMLAAARCTATSYVVTGFIGKPGYMSADQVRGVEEMGMSIGAHTVHHVPLALTAPATRVAEILGSKLGLETLLGHPVLDFAYPYGSYNPDVEAAVRAAGFRTAMTTVGSIIQPVSDRFALRRIHVNGDQSLSDFASSLVTVPPSRSNPPPRAAPGRAPIRRPSRPNHAAVVATPPRKA